jgi:hypothetical protein
LCILVNIILIPHENTQSKRNNCNIFIRCGLFEYYMAFYKYNNKEKKILTDADRKNIAGSFIKLSRGVTHYELKGPKMAR